MNNLLPNTTTATELQRNYKKVVAQAKKAKKPLTVLSNNKPELIIMDYNAYQKGVSIPTSGRNKIEDFLGVITMKEARRLNKISDEMNENLDEELWK